jgi:hypothetical protein
MNMNRPTLAAAVLEFVLLFPATLFMVALVIRNLPLHEMTNGAQWIVMWYAGRLWTLWFLLLALPFVVLVTGCMVLFRGRVAMPNTAQQPLALIRAQPAIGFIAVLTLSAAAILVIVVLHMLAN